MYESLSTADSPQPQLPAGVAVADLLSTSPEGKRTAAANSPAAIADASMGVAPLLRRMRPHAAVLGITMGGGSREDEAAAEAEAEAAGNKAACVPASAHHALRQVSPQRRRTAANLTDVRRLLNRLLVLPIVAQQQLFDLFNATLSAEVRSAKAEGRFSEGLSELPGSNIRAEGPPQLLCQHAGSTLGTYVTTLALDRGVSWEAAQSLHGSKSTGVLRRQMHTLRLLSPKGGGDGFYMSKRELYGRTMIILAVRKPGQRYLYGMCVHNARRALAVHGTDASPYSTRPNTGVSFIEWDREELLSKYERVSDLDAAAAGWTAVYEASLQSCMHGAGEKRGAAGQAMLVIDDDPVQDAQQAPPASRAGALQLSASSTVASCRSGSTWKRRFGATSTPSPKRTRP
jgi:hypothetical protein